MRGPGIAADFVLTRPRVAAGGVVHLQQNEVAEPAFLQTPGSAQAGDTAADDYERNALFARCGGNGRTIADLMAAHERVIHERSRQAPFALGGHPNQRCATSRDEVTPGRAQWLISFQSRSYARTST